MKYAQFTLNSRILDTTKRQVLMLLVDGYRTASVARKLNYSYRAIVDIKAAMRDLLDARTDAQIVTRAIEYGELRFDDMLGEWR